MNEKTVKGIVFDFNGTMIYDGHIHRSVWKDVILERTGENLSDADFEKRIWGRDSAQIIRSFFKDPDDGFIARLTFEKEAEYRKRCVSLGDKFGLVDGLCEYLDQLKESGCRMTIATGSDIHNVKFYFEYLSIGKWFDFDKVIYDDNSFKGKPEPEIFIRAFSKIGVKCEDGMVFEDSKSGVLASHRAGVKYVIALGGDAKKEDFDSVGGVYEAVKDFKNREIFPKFIK